MKYIGKFVLKEGYEEDGVFFNNESLQSMIEIYHKYGMEKIYWRGLDVAAAKDGELVSKKFEVGEVLSFDLEKNPKKLIVKLSLEQKILNLLNNKKIYVDPVFVILSTERIRANFVIAKKVRLERFLLKKNL